MKPSLSKTTSDAINKFVLNVLGAGGAIWAIFYAIPSGLLKSFTTIYSIKLETQHEVVVVTIASLAMLNAIYQLYVVKPCCPLPLEPPKNAP